MTKYIMIMTTCPDFDNATTLAEALVQQNLAACVNILPTMTSVYEWQGKSRRGSENLLLIKTTSDRYSQIESLIQSEHPYELPEIISISIENGLEEYLNWMTSQTHP